MHRAATCLVVLASLTTWVVTSDALAQFSGPPKLGPAPRARPPAQQRGFEPAQQPLKIPAPTIDKPLEQAAPADAYQGDHSFSLLGLAGKILLPGGEPELDTSPAPFPSKKLSTQAESGKTVASKTVPSKAVPGKTVPGKTVPGKTVPGKTVTNSPQRPSAKGEPVAATAPATSHSTSGAVSKPARKETPAKPTAQATSADESIVRFRLNSSPLTTQGEFSPPPLAHDVSNAAPAAKPSVRAAVKPAAQEAADHKTPRPSTIALNVEAATKVTATADAKVPVTKPSPAKPTAAPPTLVKAASPARPPTAIASSVPPIAPAAALPASRLVTVKGVVVDLDSQAGLVHMVFPGDKYPPIGTLVELHHGYLFGKECMGALKVVRASGGEVVAAPVGNFNVRKVANGDSVVFQMSSAAAAVPAVPPSISMAAVAMADAPAAPALGKAAVVKPLPKEPALPRITLTVGEAPVPHTAADRKPATSALPLTRNLDSKPALPDDADESRIRFRTDATAAETKAKSPLRIAERSTPVGGQNKSLKKVPSSPLDSEASALLPPARY